MPMVLLSRIARRAPLFVTAFIAYSWVSKPVRALNGPKIGIIGAGVGGTSCAYFLRELFGDSAVIELFEKGEVGGRVATVTIGGEEYESGGSIIHPSNQYMVNLTKILGLRHRAKSDDKISFYDGKEFPFIGSFWSVVTTAKLFWRYGYDVVRVGMFVQQLMKDFNRIYQQQQDGQAFTDMELLLESMSPRFVNMTQQPLKNYLLSYGFSERFVDELAMAAMRTNYGQTTSVHAFVGAISLAGVEPGLWAVHGGNKKVPIALSSYANDVHDAEVTKVTLQTSESGDVTYKVDFLTSSREKSSAVFDLVVIAHPLHKETSDVEFKNFPDPGVHYKQRDFQRTVATFVKGTPNVAKFGFTSVKSFPTGVLTVNPNVFFNSIGLHYPVDQEKGDQHLSSVYKVFSKAPLTDAQLKELFVSIDETKVVDWLAYPKFTVPEQLPSFILHNHMYYLNCVEYAASAMEMEVIAAKNVALLAYNQWMGLVDKIDAHAYEKIREKDKTEL